MAKKAKAPRAGTARAAKAKARKPSQIPLIPQARHTKLDAICESLGRSIDKRTKLERDEDGDKQAGLEYMVKHSITAYHHFGTELVVRPGPLKLSVRKHKEASESAPKTMQGDEALGE